ncbi:MAG: hypothetical protein L0K34_01455 [Ancrocorticia sp.]|nr:hypothetical protein [Ancrocorticia sp.]
MVHPQHITSAITEWIGPVRWHLGESTDLTARGYTTLHSDQVTAPYRSYNPVSPQVDLRAVKHLDHL